jgi:hypothetical protein
MPGPLISFLKQGVDLIVKKLQFLLTIALIFTAHGAFALDAVGNCDDHINASGTVTEVLLGKDEELDQKVSFVFVPQTTKAPIEISVYKTIEEPRGESAFALLLTAFTTRSQLEITRCWKDSVVGFGLFH